MRKQITILASIALLAACTTKEETVILRKESHKAETSPKVNANRLLTIEIDGMTCVMGCGASIRKELYATKAVLSVDFDFEDGRKTNTAKIAFDKDKITVDKMVEIISTMNEKQFTVGKTKSEDYNSKISSSNLSNEESISTKKETESTIKSTSRIELPNFLDIFSRIITG